MDARYNKEEADGHKSIIEQGDEHSNCTKKDIVKLLMDKCIYLISALIIALHNFQKKTWRGCCDLNRKFLIFCTQNAWDTVTAVWHTDEGGAWGGLKKLFSKNVYFSPFIFLSFWGTCAMHVAFK